MKVAEGHMTVAMAHPQSPALSDALLTEINLIRILL